MAPNIDYLYTKDLFVATVMLLTDSVPDKVDALFFYSRSFGDDNGLFEIVFDQYKKNKDQIVLLNSSDGRKEGGTTPSEAWPGKDIWIKKLIGLGVDNIVLAAETANTKAESYAFLEKSKELGLTSAVVIAQPHQLVRAMLTLVKAMSESNIEMDIYCLCPHATSWQKEVFGSQGEKRMERRQHIVEEFSRIIKYQQKGDLAIFRELFSYLSKRKNVI